MWKRALLIAALVIAGSSLSQADLREGVFQSKVWKVKLSPPRGWQASDHSTYPGVLLWMLHQPTQSRMLFAAEKILPSMKHAKSAQDYATHTAVQLQALGYVVRAPQLHSATGAFWMDFNDGKHFLRQAVLVPDGSDVGYSLSLSTSDPKTRSSLLRVFDHTLRSVKPRRDAKN